MRDYNTKHSIIQGKALKKLQKKTVKIDFDGGDITSDGGLFLAREIDKDINLLAPIAEILDKHDTRQLNKVRHSNLRMLRQRVHAIAAGYEDVNDHDMLRKDKNHQMAADATENLASSPTLSRFENKRPNRKACLRMMEAIVVNFINSFTAIPQELVLDFDATDDPVHGNQEGRSFHGYYDHYCFLPLYVFCGDRLLVPLLRTANQDQAKYAWVILRMLVKRFRAVWPKVKITLRADGGFCRWKMLSWCDKNDVKYIVGISKNKRLSRFSSHIIRKAEKNYNRTGTKAKLFTSIYYAAATWDCRRRVIVKAEYNCLGPNTRYVVTNISGDSRQLYDKLYCARGDMENRIKEQQLYLFADRTSCHAWWANQFRLLLSSLAYILLETLRRKYLYGTKLIKAQMVTIRNKLIKIGATITRNTRSIYLHLSSTYAYKGLLSLVVERLVPD